MPASDLLGAGPPVATERNPYPCDVLPAVAQHSVNQRYFREDVHLQAVIHIRWVPHLIPWKVPRHETSDGKSNDNVHDSL